MRTDVAGTVHEHEDDDSTEDFGDTCTDLAGTVNPLPSASRLAINERLYAASQVKRSRGYKPCTRCSFPCGMRSKKCQDKERCTYVMIFATDYKKTKKTPEEQTTVAALRIKAVYDEKD